MKFDKYAIVLETDGIGRLVFESLVSGFRSASEGIRQHLADLREHRLGYKNVEVVTGPGARVVEEILGKVGALDNQRWRCIGGPDHLQGRDSGEMGSEIPVPCLLDDVRIGLAQPCTNVVDDAVHSVWTRDGLDAVG
jgi:hypothetical protein